MIGAASLIAKHSLLLVKYSLHVLLREQEREKGQSFQV